MTETGNNPGPESGGASAPREGKRPHLSVTVARLLAAVLGLLLFLWAFFSVAGRFDWVAGWAYFALLFLGHGVSALWIRARNPEVLRHRGRIGPGTKNWDAALLTLFGLGYLSSVFVAAADAGRSGVSGLPSWTPALGATLLLIALWVVALSMIANPHFEKTARIQRDRDHKVVATGPYRYIRHPGYLALIGGWVTAPSLVLGSAWALVPAGVAAIALVIRTALEDRMLRRELEGYEGYAAAVRSRLLPGIW